LLEPDEARQALRPARARKEAELHFGQAALRGRRRDAVVAAERDFETAPEGRAVDGPDDGLRARVVGVDDRTEDRLLRRLAELGDVRPCDERAALACEDDRFDARVGERLGETIREPLANGVGQRVHGWVVDGDDANVVSPLEGDDGGHAVASASGGEPRGTRPRADASRSPRVAAIRTRRRLFSGGNRREARPDGAVENLYSASQEASIFRSSRGSRMAWSEPTFCARSTVCTASNSAATSACFSRVTSSTT